MKRTLSIIIILIAATGLITAQNRIIARGAAPGKLHLSTTWHGLYAPIGPPFYLEALDAILHITQNGKKAEIVFGTDILEEPDGGRIKNYELRIEEVKVFDVLGRMMVATQHAASREGTTTIDISHLPVGIYFARIMTEKGAITKKIVKQ